jgi:hypothetical protein
MTRSDVDREPLESLPCAFGEHDVLWVRDADADAVKVRVQGPHSEDVPAAYMLLDPTKHA